jgi:hypothetical protein
MDHKRLRLSFETRESALLWMTAVYVLRGWWARYPTRFARQAALPTLRIHART